jgi:hypothetical protein
MREVLAVNVVDMVSVPKAFLPLLQKFTTPRLIFVSLTTGSITIATNPNRPLHGGGLIDYRTSKQLEYVDGLLLGPTRPKGSQSDRGKSRLDFYSLP